MPMAASPVNVPLALHGRAQGKTVAIQQRVSDALRVEHPTHAHALWTGLTVGEDVLTSSDSPRTSSSVSGESEREWRRSLAAESDPIYKESGRSRSRDPPNVHDPADPVSIQQRQGSRNEYSNRRTNGFTHAHGNGHAYINGHHRHSRAETYASPSTSSASSFPALPDPAEEHAIPVYAHLRHINSQEAAHLHCHPFRTSTRQNDDMNVDDESPLRRGAGTWTREEYDDGPMGNSKTRPSRSLSGSSDWQVPSRRSQSSTGMSAERDSGRPPMAQRALSINTAALGPVAGAYQQQHTFSPSSFQSNSPDNFALHPGSSPRLGLGRLPEGEEATNATCGFFAQQAMPLSFMSQSQQQQQHHQAQRHRSTSSAAALQGFGGRGGSSSGGMGSERERGLHDQYSRSASLWAAATPMSADLASSIGSPSFSHYQRTAVPSPAMSRFTSAGGGGRGRTPEQRNTSAWQESAGLASLPTHDHHQAVLDDMQRAVSGTDSRRHSMTGAPLTGQRRAIGFEVSRPLPGSRTSSVGRFAGAPQRSGYGSFGGGSLAISDEDLASGFDALRVDLEEAAHQQQQRQTYGGLTAVGTRKPSRDAAVHGAHASSMPPGYNGFGGSPAERGASSEWPISARPQNDDGALIWSGESALMSSPLPSAVWSTMKQQQQQQQHVAPPAKRSSIGEVPPFEPFGSKTASATSTSTAGPDLAKPGLSDHAIASLVTLGPLAPPSGGPGPHDGSAGGLQDLGKGVPLQMLPRSTPLYIVEFKQGRTDLYFRQSRGVSGGELDEVRKGDLVIVEADRGKDLGSVINDSITVDQVQTFLAQQAELAQGGGGSGSGSNGGQAADGVHPAAMTLSRLTRSVNPKRLFAKAGPADTSLLHAKAQDEERALTLCTTKVNQRGLPMAVVAAEMQWDRRKLTFYYTATQRVDFRDLVKELFRLYKTRIWMCHLSHPSNAGSSSAGPPS